MWYSWFFILEAVVIVTGNVTVLVVFTRTPSLRKRKHFLLVSLAVADLLVGVISVPMYVTIFYVGNMIIYQIQDILFATASMFGLMAVAIERAYAVYFPFKHRTLWKGVYMIGIAVIWMMAAFIAISSTIRFDGIIITISMLNAPIIFSLVVIIISYFLIWIKVNFMTNTHGHAIQRHDNRLTVTLLIVTVISLVAWIPFQVIMVYWQTCINCSLIATSVVYTSKFLHYGNSLVNPIIYALRMPKFRTPLLYRLRSCAPCNNSFEQNHGHRPNTNRTNDDNDAANQLNAGNHDNGLGILGNNGNELELDTLDNHEGDVNHPSYCREREKISAKLVHESTV